jgi:DNA-directed RNA polymerase specialized sigma24 family protein
MEDPVTTTSTVSTDLRAAFENKVRAGIFNPVARFLPEDVREDRLQEGIALTWAMYQRYAERGELLDDRILVHACRLKATDPSRYLASADGRRKGDVFDPRSFMNGCVEVLRLADLHEDEEDEGEGHQLARRDKPTSIGFAEVRCTNPVRRILSAIDLTAWLAELAPADRRILELRAAGYTLEEAADELGVSLTSVFHACRRLGLALAERAGIQVEPRQHKPRRAEKHHVSTQRARAATADTPATRGGPRRAPGTGSEEARRAA